MNKSLFLLPFILLVFGCSFNETDGVIDQKKDLVKPTEQIKIPDEVPTTKNEGYFIENDYLWHNDKKILDESLTSLLWANDPNHDTALRIWHKITEPDGKIKIYLDRSGGCTGCNYISPYYFIIDPKTDFAGLAKFQNVYLTIFKDKAPLIIISPSGKQIARVEYESKDNEDIVRSETVWLLNLVSETEKKVADIKANETVLYPLEGDGMFSGLPAITENAIYFETDKDGKEKLIVNPRPYHPAELLQKNENNFKNVCEKGKNCDGLVAFQPQQNEGYTNNGYLIIDSKRNLVVDDQVNSSRYTHNLTLYPIDFNNDDQNEYILYYNDQNNGKPALPGDNIKVYRFDGSKWVTEYEKKEGLIDGASDTHTLIKNDSLWIRTEELDNSGQLEAIVKLEIQTLFNDPVYKYIKLKWDGTKIIEEPFEATPRSMRGA